MGRFFRLLTVCALLLILTGLCLAIAAALFFKPGDLKPYLADYAYRVTGKTLRLDGDISLSLFPSIQVETGPVILEESPAFGNAPFIRIGKISGRVALGPLLRGDVVIAALLLEDTELKLVRNSEGKANWKLPSPALTRATDGSVRGILAHTPLEKAVETTANSLQITPLGNDGAALPLEPSPTGILPALPLSLDTFHITALGFRNTRISYRDHGSDEVVTAELPLASLNNFSPGEQMDIVLQGTFTLGEDGDRRPFSLEGTATPFASGSLDLPVSFGGIIAGAAFQAEGLIALPGAERNIPAFSGSLTADTLTLNGFLSSAGKPSAEPDYGLPPPVLSRAERREAERLAEQREKKLFRRLKSWLETWDLSLDIAVGSLTAGAFRLEQIKAGLTAGQGRLELFPFKASFAGGTLTLRAALETKEDRPLLKSNGTAENMRLPEAVAAFAPASGLKIMPGRLSLTWNLNGQGLLWNHLAPTLAGDLSLTISNGFIPSLAIIPEGVPDLPALTRPLLIESLTGTWQIDQGVAASDDLRLKASPLTANGAGTLRFAEGELDWRLTMRLPDLPNIPARITGPLFSPTYSLDTGS